MPAYDVTFEETTRFRVDSEAFVLAFPSEWDTWLLGLDIDEPLTPGELEEEKILFMKDSIYTMGFDVLDFDELLLPLPNGAESEKEFSDIEIIKVSVTVTR